jgi:predicted restriction endonuclease
LGDSDEDLLPLLERRYSLPGQLASTGSLSADLTDDDLREETEIDPVEARIERVRASERGSGAAAFRQRVREAYDDRCVFSGQRLPRTELTSRVGVDAAHILPWSRYDLDDTRNGLCLAKQCHWAFDQGILRLTYDDRQTAYVLAIPEQFKTAAVAARFDLPEFEKLEGVVPEARLPKNRALWPSKTYLRELNQYLDGRLA